MTLPAHSLNAQKSLRRDSHNIVELGSQIFNRGNRESTRSLGNGGHRLTIAEPTERVGSSLRLIILPLFMGSTTYRFLTARRPLYLFSGQTQICPVETWPWLVY